MINSNRNNSESTVHVNSQRSEKILVSLLLLRTVYCQREQNSLHEDVTRAVFRAWQEGPCFWNVKPNDCHVDVLNNLVFVFCKSFLMI